MHFNFILCILFIHATHAQTLFGSVQSVTTYDSCSVSPLAESPFKFGSPDTNFASPCDSIGTGQTVTEVRVLVFPNRVPDQDNLVFSTSFAPKHTNKAGFSGEYNIDDVCGGSPIGANCSVLNDKLVVSIESTALYADYQLLRRGYNAPYAYEVSVCQTDLNDPSDISTPFYAIGGQTCKQQNSANLGCFFAGVDVGGINTGGSATSACPGSVSKGGKFYTPPSPDTVTTQCNTLYCRTQQPNSVGVPWVSMTPNGVYPLCSIFDIQPRPSGKMNLRVTVDNGTQSQQILLSTTQSGTVQAVPGLLFARINNINTGVGIIGNSLGGAIVTCKSQEDSDPNHPGDIANGLLNDAATTDADGFTIANPFYSQACPGGICNNAAGKNIGILGYTNCNLPAAPCRKNIGADNPNSFWYYVPQELITQYGLGCNQNGLQTNSIYSRPDIQLQVCEEASFCQMDNDNNSTTNDCSPGASTCIPGFQQFSSQTLRPASHVFTPCQVNQQFASYLDEYSKGNFDGYFWMPSEDPEDPSWWLVGDVLRSPAIGGSSNEVSVDLSIYIVGEFLGEIQTASTGMFASASQICSAVQGGVGTAVASVRNTGASPGSFAVTALFNTTEGGASFTIDSTGVTSQVGDLATIVQPIAVAATSQFSFDYTYDGADTSKITVTFTLYTLAGNGELIKLETTTLGCDIVDPIQFENGVGAFNEFNPGNVGQHQCSGTFNIFCWTNLSLRDWIGHLVAITILLIPAIMIVLSIIFLSIDAVKYTQRVKLAHEQKELEAEAQRIGKEKGEKIARENAMKSNTERVNYMGQ